MNIQELIKEAAERYMNCAFTDDLKTPQMEYSMAVTHFLTEAEKAGYKLLKVDIQTDADIQKVIPEFGSTRFHLTVDDIHKALAIGREQGRKEDKWIRVEAKPERSGYFLCCEDWDKYGRPFVAYYDKEDDMFYQKCTHWMPLPPKTEQS